MWEISLTGQIQTFALGVLLGFILSIHYDFTVGLSNALNIKIYAIIFDLNFFIVSAIITFLLLLTRTNGEIRGYFLFAELSGFFVSKKLFSNFLVKQLSKIFNKIFKSILIIDNNILMFGQKSYKNIIKTLKISMLYYKKLLKFLSEILYNNIVKKNSKE